MAATPPAAEGDEVTTVTFIDMKTSEIYCPICKERCRLPIPGPVSVVVRFMKDYERYHRKVCARPQPPKETK